MFEHMNTLCLMASASWSVLECVVKRAVWEMTRCRRLSDALTSVEKQPDIRGWSMMPWRRLRRKGETTNQWQGVGMVSWPQECQHDGKERAMVLVWKLGRERSAMERALV